MGVGIGEQFHHVEYAEALGRRCISRAATSPTGSCPTRPSTSWTRLALAPSCEAGYSEFGEINKSIRVAVEQMENAVSQKDFERARNTASKRCRLARTCSSSASSK